VSVLKRVGRQASFYVAAEALSSLTGFISFPIFTRIFSQAQYGVLGLVDSTFKFASTVSGMGLRPAVVRLWGEFKAGKRPGGTGALASSMLSASVIIGAAVSLLFLLVLFVPESLLTGEARRLIALCAGLILFRNLTQMVLSIVQSQERAALRSGILVAERYLAMGIPLLFAAAFGWGLTGFFTGTLLAEGLIFLYCLVYALRRLDWRWRILDLPVVKESMLYGLPLLGLNVSGFVTDWGDRYLLSYFRTEAELGLYTAGYNMANYVTMFLVSALNSALIPVTMNVWNEEGPDSARASLESFLRYYSLVALPVLFGVSAVAEELIGLLASAKYLPAAAVIPWVLGAKVIQGAYYPFLAGLFLTKRTGWLALFLAVAALLNLGLNWVMIPSMGMVGAAITTLIAYAVYVFGGGLFSQRYLRLRFPLRSFAVYTLAGAAMYLAVRAIPSAGDNHALTLALRVPAGVAVYGALAFGLDPPARAMLRSALGRLRRGRRRPPRA
jgi:O-antigen/teichoic acid export membrane protein